MGDQGRIYVDEDVVPAYKEILREADLILPNQFEAEYVSQPSIVKQKTARRIPPSLTLSSGSSLVSQYPAPRRSPPQSPSYTKPITSHTSSSRPSASRMTPHPPPPPSP